MKKSYLVKPTPLVAAFQLILILLFSVGLYMYLQSLRTEKHHRQKLRTIQTRSQQIQATEARLQTYRSYISDKPRLAGIKDNMTWEEVEITWDNVAFSELLYRLNNVYSDDRLFVLKSFSFKDNDGTGTPITVALDEENETTNRKFELKGYYLCLCQ